MDKEDPMVVISKLQDAVSSSEADIIIAAAITAGYLWRCSAPLAGSHTGRTCSYVNEMGNETCDGCSAPCPPECRPRLQVVHVSWHGVTLCGKPLHDLKWCPHERSAEATCEICRHRSELYRLHR